jgi:hypothetical protein
MVGISTYRLMHGEEDEEPSKNRVELGEDEMAAGETPAEPFILLLPAIIRGYGFYNKNCSMHTQSYSTCQH